MDNAGWRAQRRSAAPAAVRYRGPDGRFTPVERQALPIPEHFIGGFNLNAGPPATPPPVPPKGPSDLKMPQVSNVSTGSVAHMSAVERSRNLRQARMHPHLQIMCGPLLRFDTMDEHGVWHGAVLVVTADVGSVYEPYPTLTYSWDPDQRRSSFTRTHRATSTNGRSFDLGPHPADPAAMSYAPVIERSPADGPRSQARQADGQEIWVYEGNGGCVSLSKITPQADGPCSTHWYSYSLSWCRTSTFWRFHIQIPLSETEMRVRYNLNSGQDIEFVVPGRNETMRIAAYSCNGFSAGVNPDDFRGPGFQSGYDPVWVDLLLKHSEKPFHVLMGGGDQLYCDGLVREPEMQEWLTNADQEAKKRMPLTQEITEAIDRFYFNHYCNAFRSGAFARANSSMCVLIDGFGSYPDDLMRSPIFGHIGSRGYFFFLLFQCFISPEIDGYDDRPGGHWCKSLVIGAPGPFIPFPSHSILARLGPTTAILMLDCRAERMLTQVCSQEEYRKVLGRVNALSPNTDHLIIQLGIPIAYPRMVFLETMLSSKLNPLVNLSRSGTLLKGFVNKFNADAELLDDLNDHWTSKHHKTERNWFVEQLQSIALNQRLRISFVSGDVHCGAVGVFKTLVKNKKQPDIQPAIDFRYMVNIVTSAIVNTPPPGAVLSLVNSLSTKTHSTMHSVNTDETMIPLFQTDTDGARLKSPYIIGRRNWCSISRDTESGEMVFDLRVEKMKGHGVTVGYVTRVPAPRWQAPPR
ncbi:hypothetical protein K488DRAFT_76303 [Vararia minispora EC-137]|uniref:Uncharacterized protein n=1 Tax=Vararia minispora EC-137 TaxID=1314806 RepID=A0ACB8QWQ1_9AGAM|nr:hypothetical protein K488DRAFT_76303 [Vararia minispora EC-137]